MVSNYCIMGAMQTSMALFHYFVTSFRVMRVSQKEKVGNPESFYIAFQLVHCLRLKRDP
jgi:hypothetical protein